MLTGQTRLKLMHIYTLTFRIRALTWIFSKIVRSSRFSATPNKTKKAHWYTTLFKLTWEITNATFEQVQIFLKSEGPIAQTSQESFASEFVQNSEHCTSVTCTKDDRKTNPSLWSFHQIWIPTPIPIEYFSTNVSRPPTAVKRHHKIKEISLVKHRVIRHKNNNWSTPQQSNYVLKALPRINHLRMDKIFTDII